MYGLGLHIMQFPSKRWGFVGDIPMALGRLVKPTKQDIMAGRAWKDDTGHMVTVKFPTFHTKELAEAHIQEVLP